MATDGFANEHRTGARIAVPRRRVRRSTRVAGWFIIVVVVGASVLGLDVPRGLAVEPTTTSPLAKSAVAPATVASTVASTPQQSLDALSRRGSISFRKTPMQEVIFLLSDLWQINIVAGDQVNGDVTGTFHDAPLREVLTAILSSSGYSYTTAGNSLVVLPADQVGTDNPDFRSETIRLPMGLGADAASLMSAASMLLSERGKIQLIGDSTALVIDTQEGIDRVSTMLRQFAPGSAADSRQPTATAADVGPTANSTNVDFPAMKTPTIQIEYFTPQYTEASEMSEALTNVLGGEAVVAIYEAENRVMVKGDAAMLNLARQAIAALDVPRRQVRITTMIYDVDLAELERLGVSWGRGLRTEESLAGTALAGLAGSVDNAMGVSTLGTDGLSSLTIRTITNRFDTTMLLEALDSSSEAKLLADPSITCADRTQASIKIVERIPVIAINPVEGSNVVVAQVEFEDAGVILNVLPRIGRDGTIELKVQPEYSVVTGFTGTDNNRFPIIDSRTAETTVRVGDGHMFVLGGLRQKTVTETIRGVPYLRDMRFIGKLFRSHETEVRESELIVFIRPELISPYDCGSPRQQVAGDVLNYELDAIAHATTCPQLGSCKDPHCPHHHPRPRVNGGSHSLRMLGGEGLTPQLVPQWSDADAVQIRDQFQYDRVAPEQPPVLFELESPMEYGETFSPAPVHVQPLRTGS